MKRFNRREQTILKMMALVVSIALLMEVHERYLAHKESLIGEIDSKRGQITTYLKELEGQDAEKYRKDAAAIEEELEGVQGRVLELPKEEDASLLIRETISETAETAGMTINSISSRKSRDVSEDKGLRELRTYFGYDTDLRALLKFFESFEDENYYLVIESLNVSARRQPRRRANSKNRKPRTNKRKKAPLNGNAVLASVFKENAEADIKRYDRDRSAGAVAKPKAEPKPEPVVAEAPKKPESSGVGLIGNKPVREPGSSPVKRPDPNIKPQPRNAGPPPKTGVTTRPGKLKPKGRPLTDTAKPKKHKTKFRM